MVNHLRKDEAQFHLTPYTTISRWPKHLNLKKKMHFGMGNFYGSEIQILGMIKKEFNKLTIIKNNTFHGEKWKQNKMEMESTK